MKIMSKILKKWYNFMSIIEPSFENGFEYITRKSVYNPCNTIVVGFAFVVLCMVGFIKFTVITEGENLWIPSTSSIKSDHIYIQDNYAPNMEPAIVLFTNSNVLTIEVFNHLWDIFDNVKEITVGDLTYTDMCVQDYKGDCTSLGPLQFWSQNRTLFNDNVQSDADLLSQISVNNFPDGQVVKREKMFGKMTLDSMNNLISAESMSNTFGVTRGGIDVLNEFAGKYLTYMEGVSYSDGTMIHYITGRSINDELNRNITGDILLLVISYIIMIIFSSLVLSKKMNGVNSRIGLSLCGIGIILLAIISGYGFCSGLGVEFNSLHMILPFIVVGVGIDDMLIIVASFDMADSKLPVEDRLINSMKSCGLSITYTTSTDVVAFIVGSSSSLPAIRAFCYYAAVTFLFNFFFQITMLVALLSWDAKRMNNGNYDILYCISRNLINSFTPQLIKPEESIEIDDKDDRIVDIPTNIAKIDDTAYLTIFFRDIYAPWLTKTSSRIGVCIFFIIMFLCGIYGTSKISVGFDMIDLLPDISYAREYVLNARSMNLFVFEENIRANIYFKEGTDYSNQQTQINIMDVEGDFLSYKFNSGPFSSWIRDFQTWLPYSNYNTNVNTNGYLTDNSIFVQAVYDFVHNPNYLFYRNDVIFDYETIGGVKTPISILTTRIGGFHSQQDNSLDEIDTLKYNRKLAENIKVSPKAFAFSNQYLFAEGESLIVKEIINNLLYALLAIFMITAVMLVRPIAVILVSVFLVLIDINIIGMMYVFNLPMNTITVVQLVMAVGLVVDYISHILHYYLKQSHSITPNQRMINCLAEIGPSILLGCFTTFLGVLPLAAARSTLFRIFFKMFFSIVFQGAFHGFILLPALMPLIPFDDVRIYLIHEQNAFDMTYKDMGDCNEVIENDVITEDN